MKYIEHIKGPLGFVTTMSSTAVAWLGPWIGVAETLARLAAALFACAVGYWTIQYYRHQDSREDERLKLDREQARANLIKTEEKIQAMRRVGYSEAQISHSIHTKESPPTEILTDSDL